MEMLDLSPLWKVGKVAIVAVVLLIVPATYGINSCRRRQEVAETNARDTRRDNARRATDSAYYFNKGRRYEVARQLDSLSRHAEVLAPAGYSLPADPPRQ